MAASKNRFRGHGYALGGLGLALLLGACGGTTTLDEGTILAEGARAELIGEPAQPSADESDPLPVTKVPDVPSKVRGASNLDDFLFQSAEVALKADAHAYGPCLNRRISGRSNTFDRYEGEALDVFTRNGARRAWLTQIFVGGCDEPRRHNILVVTFDKQPTAFVPLLPGDTRTDLETQKVATRTAYGIIEARVDSGCIDGGKIRIRTTEDKGAVGLGRNKAKRAWKEIWTAHYCGKDYALTVVFTPDKSDTNIEVIESLTREVSTGWPLP